MDTVTTPAAMRKICERHGIEMEAKGWMVGTKYEQVHHSCHKCTAERELKRQQLEEARIEHERIERIGRNRDTCAIPLRFAQSTFGNYDAISPGERRVLAAVREYAVRFDDIRRQGANLTLCGKPGTGKTHLAAALANELLEREFSVAYRVMPALLRELKDVAFGSRGAQAALMERYRRVDLLILDEIGLRMGTEVDGALTFEIVDARYEACKPTVAVSNLDGAALGSVLGERVVDRLLEKGSVVAVFDWASRRRIHTTQL